MDWVAERADSRSVCFIFLNPSKDEEATTEKSNQGADFTGLAPSSYGAMFVSQNYPIGRLWLETHRVASGVIIDNVRPAAQPSESNATLAVDEWSPHLRSTTMVCRVWEVVWEKIPPSGAGSTGKWKDV